MTERFRSLAGHVTLVSNRILGNSFAVGCLMKLIACTLLLVAIAASPRAATAQVTGSGPESTNNESTKASAKPQPITPESAKTKTAKSGGPRGRRNV